MTDDNRQFTTDSSPGEQNFERTANDATTYIVGLLSSESEYWGPRMHAIIRTGVRATLRADGTVTVGSVERAIQNDELGESFGIDNQTEVLERFDNAVRGSSGNGEISMTDDNSANDTFTTDDAPDEQTFESTVADAAEFVKEMHDNDEATVTFFDPKGVPDSHNERDEQVSTANPFGRDLPPHITIGGSRSGRTHSTTQDDSSTGGDK